MHNSVMSITSYQRRLRQFDCLYGFVGELDDPCVYCGLPATGWDHVPPLHYVERLSDGELDDETLLKHPACTECNTFLGGALLHSLASRREYVKERIRRKYRSHAEMPGWDDDEIAELSTADAQRYIRAHERFAKMIKERLGWNR